MRPCALWHFLYFPGKLPSNLHIFPTTEWPVMHYPIAKKLSIFPRGNVGPAGFPSILISCTNTFHDSKTGCLTKGGNMMTKRGPLPGRRFWGQVIWLEKPVHKDKRQKARCGASAPRKALFQPTRSFSIMGDAGLFSKPCSSLLLIF